MSGFLCTATSYVGAAFLAYTALKLLLWIRLHFMQSTPILKRYAKAGKWAVVTGASDGIGKGFAVELAKKGFSIVLISRTKSKLDDVAAECEKKGKNCETKVITFDFSTATAADYKKLGNQLNGMEIGLLVNNVGINYEHPRWYDEVDIEEDLSILKVNCESQLQMTKFVLPHMKAKKCGGIISLSSYSVVSQAGLLSTYAATKAFNKTFSEAMATELKRFNIDCLAITPNMVISNMSKIRRESFSIVNPNAMARQALAKLGACTTNSGHWHHSILEYITTLLPESTRQGQVMATLLSAKKRAEAKKAAAAATK